MYTNINGHSSMTIPTLVLPHTSTIMSNDASEFRFITSLGEDGIMGSILGLGVQLHP
jgi:hypothetical protein